MKALFTNLRMDFNVHIIKVFMLNGQETCYLKLANGAFILPH